MRRHQMLMASLVLFALGIGCQLYSLFDPTEPYMQQMSFMFIAMPSVMAIIHHYYYHYSDPQTSATDPCEEKPTNLPDTANASSDAHQRTKNQTNKNISTTTTPTHHVADTSRQQKQQHRRTLSIGAKHLSCYDNDDATEGTEILFGEYK